MAQAVTGPAAGTETPDQWQFLLAVVAFLLLFGQPVVVFALAVLSPGLPSLVVIGLGTLLLAVPMARAFLRQGGSVSRVGDFILILALLQVALTLGSRVVSTAAGTTGLPPMAQPGIVLVSYPIAYYLLAR